MGYRAETFLTVFNKGIKICRIALDRRPMLFRYSFDFSYFYGLFNIAVFGGIVISALIVDLTAPVDEKQTGQDDGNLYSTLTA